jgi:hypothetical protein
MMKVSYVCTSVVIQSSIATDSPIVPFIPYKSTVQSFIPHPLVILSL